MLICICAPSFGNEPNKPEEQVQFKIKTDKPPRNLLRSVFRPPGESTHFALLFVKGDWGDYRNPPIDAMLKTSSGKAMTPKQRDLISNEFIQMSDYGRTISNYSYFYVFGVSEEDTERMVEAFLEVLEKENKARKKTLLDQKQTFQKKIAQIKKQILQKEKEVKNTKSRLVEIGKMVHYLSSEEAKKAVEELNRTADELNIERVGIKARLEAITSEHERLRAEARKWGDAQRRAYETTIWPRLEQMRVDEAIELKVVEAKKATAERIRRQAEEFYYLSERPLEIEKELIPLKKTLSNSQEHLERIRNELSKKDQFAIPPKVFRNKVTIFPVAGLRKG